MNPIISIIVPVYKVEAYLEKCINSILNQTFSEFELILVDDGSPDKCPQICEEYAKKDFRIKVIHKENGGLSDARNAGIEIAKGKYMGFVDSDDYIAPDMYDSLYRLITENGCDIAVCGAVNVGENDEAVYEDSDEAYVLNKADALYEMICNRLFTVNTWNKLYRSELFQNIRFPKGMLYEDLATTYKLISESDKVVYSPMKKYAYLQRQGSIMNVTGYNVSTDKIKIVSDMLLEFSDKALQAGILKYLLTDIYKMSACGNLTKNKEYIDALHTFYSANKAMFKNKFLSKKEKMVFYLAANMPGTLQAIYKR